ILCLALLEAPDMASEITELALNSRQYNQARNFAGFILEHDIRNRKALITKLALNSQARERFYHLFDGIEHIPARESTLAAAREILNPNEEASRQQKLATLLRNFANLTAEERQELRELSGGTPD
ncbi:MAG TPA: DNA primase, partial [Marinobacter sp.]|nr:DNA primase [Marinobacter sp.]